MKKSVFAAALFLSLGASAATQTLQGTGIDGKPCSVQIERQETVLQSVKLDGASKVFEILSETGTGYGPQTRIAPRGASEIISPVDSILGKFKHAENFFSNGETFSLDTSDLPRSEEELGGIKMTIELELSYSGDELVRVSATSRAKALLVATLASSKFICEK